MLSKHQKFVFQELCVCGMKRRLSDTTAGIQDWPNAMIRIRYMIVVGEGTLNVAHASIDPMKLKDSVRLTGSNPSTFRPHTKAVIGRRGRIPTRAFAASSSPSRRAPSRSTKVTCFSTVAINISLAKHEAENSGGKPLIFYRCTA